MAISTLNELTAAVLEQIVQPTAPVGTFVTQAESDFRALRHRYMLRDRKVSMAANVGKIALPEDFVELHKVVLNGNLLRPMSGYGTTTPDANSYFIEGTSLVVRPVSTSGAKVNLTYFAKIAPLTTAEPTNWLLEEFPMVYLHATLMHAYEWLRDADGENASRARFGEAVQQLLLDDKRSRMGGNTPVWPR